MKTSGIRPYPYSFRYTLYLVDIEMNPHFERRHYVAVAHAIATTDTREELIQKLIELFKDDNERFDSARFLKAATPAEVEAAKAHKAIEKIWDRRFSR
jgi:hypothetical protein